MTVSDLKPTYTRNHHWKTTGTKLGESMTDDGCQLAQ